MMSLVTLLTLCIYHVCFYAFVQIKNCVDILMIWKMCYKKTGYYLTRQTRVPFLLPVEWTLLSQSGKVSTYFFNRERLRLGFKISGYCSEEGKIKEAGSFDSFHMFVCVFVCIVEL